MVMCANYFPIQEDLRKVFISVLVINNWDFFQDDQHVVIGNGNDILKEATLSQRSLPPYFGSSLYLLEKSFLCLN